MCLRCERSVCAIHHSHSFLRYVPFRSVPFHSTPPRAIIYPTRIGHFVDQYLFTTTWKWKGHRPAPRRAEPQAINASAHRTRDTREHELELEVELELRSPHICS